MNQDDNQRPSENSSGAGMAATLAPGQQPTSSPHRNPPTLLPPYRVILHNDDVNTFEYVIATLVKLTPLQTGEAVTKTEEAHKSGLALLLVTHRERAELYQDQFASKGLTVTIEPAE